MKNALLTSSIALATGLFATNLVAADLRVATFNVSMDATNYASKGEAIDKDALSKALASNHQQIRNIAEIIQRVRPDVILLNEFDYIDADKGINVFRKNYLQVSQNKQVAIDYPYAFIAPVNTGLPTNFDLDKDGVKGHYKGDAHGFGFFEGHYAMAVL